VAWLAQRNEGPVQPAATPKRAPVRGTLADRTQQLPASLAQALPPPTQPAPDSPRRCDGLALPARHAAQSC
jgi:hypothetical protein